MKSSIDTRNICLFCSLFNKVKYILKGAEIMRKNYIEVLQKEYQDSTGKFHNEYFFGIRLGPQLENVHYLGGLAFPADKQYMFDDRMLEVITRALAIRYGLIQPKQRSK